MSFPQLGSLRETRGGSDIWFIRRVVVRVLSFGGVVLVGGWVESAGVFGGSARLMGQVL